MEGDKTFPGSGANQGPSGRRECASFQETKGCPRLGTQGRDDKDEGTETGGETRRSVGHVKGFFFTLTRKPLKIHMRA